MPVCAADFWQLWCLTVLMATCPCLDKMMERHSLLRSSWVQYLVTVVHFPYKNARNPSLEFHLWDVGQFSSTVPMDYSTLDWSSSEIEKHYNTTYIQQESWIWCLIAHIIPTCSWGFAFWTRTKTTLRREREPVFSVQSAKPNWALLQITFAGMDGPPTSVIGNTATRLNWNPYSS